MIGYLKGTVIDVDNNSLVLNVNGVGYLVFTDTSLIQELEEKEFYIYSHVREDQFNLYGFLTKEDLTLFKILISVKGVGPKVGISILSKLNSGQIVNAVLTDDSKTIQSVPGIGKKGAERIVLEIKGKLEALGYSALEDSSKKINKVDANLRKEVVGALQNLGYNKDEAEDRLNVVLSTYSGNMAIEILIKLCLSS